ncbi:hypothetical protein [Ignavibacterium sp.]|jgi:hypothetical protein|uniref:hypothetical protein n=2 Tax=Ignavibacterium TaxID=795750 RepID=UPI0025BC5812|nr:hypothetical protein [Ignavibacterium sp.]
MENLIIMLVLMSLSCSDNNPVDNKPENRRPVILSLTVFPDVIGPSDSAIVICNATDPDGDTLVYDWITDARLRINGANPPDDRSLFNTFENSRIFYPTALAIDTVWVQCFARDRKGKSDAKLIIFTVIRDPLKGVR